MAHAAKTATAVRAAKTTAAARAAKAKDDELAAWLARYEPVERAEIEAHERRISNRARRRAEAVEAFAGLCEATEGLAVVWRREGWSLREMVRWADGDVLTLMTLARWVRAGATRYIDRAQCRLRRPLYYARERERRQALAEERRRVGGRRTTNPCPTREAILEAWVHRRDSHAAAVRFGSLIQDLECYVDNTLLRDENGAIVGRRGGVKAWLQLNIPALYVRYTTVMRFKAMAKKLRQVVGLADPVPAVAVLAESPRGEWNGKRDYGAYEIIGQESSHPVDGQGRPETPERTRAKVAGLEVPLKKVVDTRKRTVVKGLDEQKDMRVRVPDLAVVRARAVWLEVVQGVRGSASALMGRLDALTDPERVEDANMLAGWRAKYESEITVSMKSWWWRRMVRKCDVG